MPTVMKGFVHKYNCPPANVHDCKQFRNLLTGKEEQVYADSAYKSRSHDLYLSNQGIDNQIHERAYRNKPLSQEQKRANSLRSEVRNRVESVFGILKLDYRAGKARHLGLMQVNTSMGFALMAYNLKRAVKIQDSCA